MTNPFEFFAGDLCWSTCRSRKGRTRLLDRGRAIHLCDSCFGHISPTNLERLAVKVNDDT